MEAPKIVLVHNHPSGDSTPSQGDFLLTDRVYESSDVMGIELVDHVIIGNDTYSSVLGRNGVRGNESI